MNLELMMYPMIVILSFLGFLLLLFGYNLITSFKCCNDKGKNQLLIKNKTESFTELCLNNKMYMDLLSQINVLRDDYHKDLNLLRNHEISMIWESIEGLKKKENVQ